MNTVEQNPFKQVTSLANTAKRVWISISYKKWPLSARIRWLKVLDKLIVLNKDFILETAAEDKKQSEFSVLLNEYAVIRLLIKEYRKIAKKTLGDESRSKFWSWNWMNKKVEVQKRPLGLIGIISPYNHPFSLPMSSIIPAILAGNAVIFKPAQEAQTTGSLINLLINKSLQEFGVAGIFQILPEGIEYGKELVKCSLVDKVHFTGSVPAGWSVHQENSKMRFIPATLELGGSNAAIVLSGVNLKKTARVIVWARFAGGMSCNNIKRVFAHESIYDNLCSELERQIELLSEHEIGSFPEKEAENYKKFLKNYAQSYPEMEMDEIIKPRILRVTRYDKRDLLVLQQETFVPLLPIVKICSEEEAIRLANASRFGLGATVFTVSKRKFLEIANRLNCGGVFHNDAMTEFAQPQVPFGGWNYSGYGYSHGKESLLEFVRLRNIITERWPLPKPQLLPWTRSKIAILKRCIDWLIRLS